MDTITREVARRWRIGRWALAALLLSGCRIDDNSDYERESLAQTTAADRRLRLLGLIDAERVTSPMPEASGSGPGIESLVLDGIIRSGVAGTIDVQLVRSGSTATGVVVGSESASFHFRYDVPDGADHVSLPLKPEELDTDEVRLAYFQIAAVDSDGVVGEAVPFAVRRQNSDASSDAQNVPSSLSILDDPGLVVTSVAFGRSEGERLLATGAVDDRGHGTVTIWNLTRAREHRRLPGHTAAVYALSFDASGTQVASGGADHVLRIHDVRDGALLATHGEHLDDIRAIDRTPDGRLLLTGAWDGHLISRDPSGEPLFEVDVATAVNAIATSPAVAVVAGGRTFEPGALVFVDLVAQRVASRVDYDDAATAVAVADGRLAVGIGRGTIRLYDLSTREEVAVLNPPCAPGTEACTAQAQRLGVTGLSAPRDTLSTLLFDPRPGGRLIAASLDGTVATWDVSRERMLDGVSFAQGLFSVRVEGALDGVAMGLANGTAQVFTFGE